jgi:CheY-like chemotaxis protein
MNRRATSQEGQRTDVSLKRGRLTHTPVTTLPVTRRPLHGGILLVEDREDDVVFLKRSLRKAGISMAVRVVQDGALALAYLQGDPPFSNRKKFPIPAIVFLDLYLPKKNGFEVLRWLRFQPQFKDIFVAVLTGAGNIDDIAHAYRLGANSFLTKPCRPEDIGNLATGFPSYWSVSLQPA